MTSDGIDLGSPAFAADPYPTYRQMRDAAPACWLSFGEGHGGAWFLSRYEDVAAALKDPRLSKDFVHVAPLDQLTPLDRSMLFRDPPDHARLRSLVGQVFIPKRIRDLERRIGEIVDDLLAQARAEGGMDFIADFAIPLPVIVIAELLGVPPEDRDRFRVWSDEIVGTTESALTNEEIDARVQGASAALGGYFANLIRQRRAERRSDLISALIDARDVGERLTEEELLGTCILLLVAGHETTVNLLGNGMLALLQHPGQRALLQERPELLQGAVEEMLRFDSPVQQATFRVAAEAIEVGGERIEEGQVVTALIGAANRDPKRFPDPDRFQITREPNRHLAFGLGIHFCLGAPLARTEARIAFPKILAALSGVRLAAEEPEWNGNTFLRGLRALPLAF